MVKKDSWSQQSWIGNLVSFKDLEPHLPHQQNGAISEIKSDQLFSEGLE